MINSAPFFDSCLKMSFNYKSSVLFPQRLSSSCSHYRNHLLFIMNAHNLMFYCLNPILSLTSMLWLKILSLSPVLACILLGLFHNPEDEGDMFLQNIVPCPKYMVQHRDCTLYRNCCANLKSDMNCMLVIMCCCKWVIHIIPLSHQGLFYFFNMWDSCDRAHSASWVQLRSY
jgi:hypothetical protein